MKSKPVSEFYKYANSKDGYQAWCKECMKSYRPKKSNYTTYDPADIIKKGITDYSDKELFEELLRRGYAGELHIKVNLSDSLVSMTQTTKLAQLL